MSVSVLESMESWLLRVGDTKLEEIEFNRNPADTTVAQDDSDSDQGDWNKSDETICDMYCNKFPAMLDFLCQKCPSLVSLSMGISKC